MTAHDVTAYAAAVRAALADLPARQLAELLEDLDEHLAEVAADSEVPLRVRLGPPEAYAAELREAALLAPATAAGPRGSRLLGGLRRDLDRLAQVPGVQEARDFLPELRPAWWVLRAALLLIALNLVSTGSLSLPLGPVLGLPLLVAAVVLSVRLGRREVEQEPTVRARQLALGLNTALAAVGVLVFFGLGAARDGGVVYAYDRHDPSPVVLAHEDGSPISNLFPVAADGSPLSGVLLYDQDGRPVDNLATTTGDGDEIAPLVLPGQPPRPGNSFPQQQQRMGWTDTGEYGPVGPPIGVPPSPSPSLVPSPVPSSPEPSPAPVPSPEPVVSPGS